MLDRRLSVPVVLVLLALALFAGTVVGRASGATIHVGDAGSAEGAISVEADGWTYGIPLDVPWTDAEGRRHDGDRPACLPPGEQVEQLRFAAVEVTVEGTTWRPVVWVDCRR